MSKKEQRQTTTKRSPRRLWLWGIVGVGAVGLIALVGVFQTSQSSLEAQPLPKRSDQSLPSLLGGVSWARAGEPRALGRAYGA
jgi:hypothetical protein